MKFTRAVKNLLSFDQSIIKPIVDFTIPRKSKCIGTSIWHSIVIPRFHCIGGCHELLSGKSAWFKIVDIAALFKPSVLRKVVVSFDDYFLSVKFCIASSDACSRRPYVSLKVAKC